MSEQEFETWIEMMEIWNDTEPTYYSPDGNVSESDVEAI